MNSRTERFIYQLILVASMVMGLLLIRRGPGCDGDFPRHVVHGLQSLNAGNWISSWPPFPLMDLFHGVMAKLLHLSAASDFRLNVLSWIAALLNLVLFRQISHFYVQDDTLSLRALVLLAAQPVFVIASGTVGDYIFSLLLVQSAWFCVLQNELALAAVFVGVASGFRMSNCVWALPLALLTARLHGKSRAAGFLVSSAVVGFLAWLGTLLKLHFDFAAFASGYSELTTWSARFKAATSKVIAVWGLPLLIVTVAVCRRAAWRKAALFARANPELLLALFLQYAVFFYLPSELGYLITTLPLIALLLPTPDRVWKSIVQVVAVFALNFVVLDIQNKIPSKLHVSHGYYIAEYTCKETDTCFEAWRFSLPAGYYPVGDWTTASRPRDRF